MVEKSIVAKVERGNEMNVDGIEQKLDNLTENLEDIKKQIEELKMVTKEQMGRWKPKNGEDYYYISDEGGVYRFEWNDTFVDKGAYAIGNVFKTEEEAEFEAQRLKMLTELKRYARPFKAYSDNWELYYSYKFKKIDVRLLMVNQTLNALYFDSQERAQEAIDAIGEDLIKKYFFE